MSGTNNSGINQYLGTSNILAGIASLTLNGNVYDVINASYSPSYIQYETLISLNGVSGLKATPRAGFISATLRDNGAISVSAINVMTNANIVLITASGKQVVGSGMWHVGEPSEVDVSEGTFAIRFEGVNVNEILTTPNS